jgi:hypothetical protein
VTDELPQGYEPHELPVDYEGNLWIEGQMRAYGAACAAAERERLLVIAKKRADHEASAAAHHCGTWHEAFQHHLLAHKAMRDLIDIVWPAAAIRKGE